MSFGFWSWQRGRRNFCSGLEYDCSHMTQPYAELISNNRRVALETISATRLPLQRTPIYRQLILRTLQRSLSHLHGASTTAFPSPRSVDNRLRPQWLLLVRLFPRSALHLCYLSRVYPFWTKAYQIFRACAKSSKHNNILSCSQNRPFEMHNNRSWMRSRPLSDSYSQQRRTMSHNFHARKRV